MFPTVAETLGKVCSCGRELYWRQLGLKPHKLYLLHDIDALVQNFRESQKEREEEVEEEEDENDIVLEEEKCSVKIRMLSKV